MSETDTPHTQAVRDTWLSQLRYELNVGVLTETQNVIDYRNALEAISDDDNYHDVNWPEYPSA